MAKRRKTSDPHASREAANYKNPIPSREHIADLITDDEIGYDAIAEKLGLSDEDSLEALRRRLNAMVRDRQLRRAKGGFALPDSSNTVIGTVQGHRDGYGFLVIDGEPDDIFLTAGQMRGVFNGDLVGVEVTGFDRRGRQEGRIVEVLQRNTTQLVGRFHSDPVTDFVAPDNSRIPHPVEIAEADANGARDGDFVLVEITAQPTWRKSAAGRVLEVLGGEDAAGVATEVALRSHDVPFEWPQAAIDEAQALATEPTEKDKKYRVDLRALPLVTIDGEDARDFDDAVYCEPRKGGGWRLWVAIADVSHYVRPGSALDDEAQLRATSVYFPDRVVPMLPEALSNGLCSLKPAVDRLCMVAEMTISANGKLTGYRFFEAVMHSKARLTYTQVAAALGMIGADGIELPASIGPVMGPLRDLQSLFHALLGARKKRGAIEFETVETRASFDDEGRLASIDPVYRNDAHRIIEECMLLANVATAKVLGELDLPGLFRVHEGPSETRLKNLRAFLGEIGLHLAGGDKPTPIDYRTLLESVSERPDHTVIQTMMLRSLSQAVYQPDNQGHFGLSYDAYAHFTSPIRRYPDLLVHRALRYAIRAGLNKKLLPKERWAKKYSLKSAYPYDAQAMAALGEHCSMAERRADDASRDVMAWLKCEFLRQHVGDEFEALVTAVTSFGLFAELKPLYIEGMLHITGLGKDYFVFDAAKQRLVGERSRRSYQLGDIIKVKVLRVDLDDRKIDLGLVDQPGGGSGGPSPVSKVAARKARGKRKSKGGGKPAEGKDKGGGARVPGKKAKGGGKGRGSGKRR